MMKTRLLREAMIINSSYGSRYLMEKTILPNLISIRQQLKLLDGVLSKEDFSLLEEELLISVSDFGTRSISNT